MPTSTQNQVGFVAFDFENMQDDIRTSESSLTSVACAFTQDCALAGTYCIYINYGTLKKFKFLKFYTFSYYLCSCYLTHNDEKMGFFIRKLEIRLTFCLSCYFQ